MSLRKRETEMSTVVNVQYWETEVHLRERDDDGPFMVANFTTENAAIAAATWAYENRLVELHAREDASKIETVIRHRNNMKITWWKKVVGGFTCQKDYFYASEKLINTTVNDS